MTGNLNDHPQDGGAFAIGTMHFGTRTTTREAHRILDCALDLGARHWDTANNYAFWMPGATGDESETCVGEWLARHPGQRDAVFLTTKVGARPRPGYRDLDHVLGLSGPMVRAQVDESLRRLRTDRIDLLYAHIDDREVPLAETLGVLGELRDEGVIGQFGASNLTSDRLHSAIEAATGPGGGYRHLQQRFTFLTPAPRAHLHPHVLLTDEMIAACMAAGWTAHGYAPLLSGAYTRADRPLPAAYDTKANRTALPLLHRIGEAHGADAGQVVLGWMMHRRLPVRPVVGVSSPDHLRSAVEASALTLSEEELGLLESARISG